MGFQEHVDQYYRPLYRFALSLSRNENAAWDLTQQTFFLWAKYGHQLRDETKIKTWLFNSLYREFLAYRKRESRFVVTEMNEDEYPAEDIAPADLESLEPGVIDEALRGLAEEHRAALTLFYFKSLSYKDIAAVLNVPIGTVMSRISRGKVELRKFLAKDSEGRIVQRPRRKERTE